MLSDANLADRGTSGSGSAKQRDLVHLNFTDRDQFVGREAIGGNYALQAVT
jgi:hypothetical protein